MKFRAFLWHGHLLMIASGLEVPAHSHVAHQLAVDLDGPFEHADAHDRTFEGEGFVVPSEVEHGFRSGKGRQLILWAEPHSIPGRKVGEIYPDDTITVLDSETAERVRKAMADFDLSLQAECGPDEGLEMRHAFWRALLPDLEPSGEIDDRVRRALDLYFEHRTEDVSVGEVARRVGLSEAHFSRLFAKQVGVPPSRYRLWMRMIDATRRLGEGSTITDAAHAAGFADAAHFTRTYTRLCGGAPSRMWFESDLTDIVICDERWWD